MYALPEFQRYIQIFDLVTAYKKCIGYLDVGARIGRDMSFPARCKSESYPTIISDTHLIPWQNSSITS